MQQCKRMIRSMIASVLILSIFTGFAFLTVHGAKTADELQQEIEELERKSEEIEAEHEIALGTRWCIARVKLSGGDLDEKRHSFTPFMESGYAAFTNPIFWEENRK